MTPEAWIALATVFCLGAMSPGPSLAVVLRNTLSGGRRQGVMTGIGQALDSGYMHFLQQEHLQQQFQYMRLQKQD